MFNAPLLYFPLNYNFHLCDCVIAKSVPIIFFFIVSRSLVHNIQLVSLGGWWYKVYLAVNCFCWHSFYGSIVLATTNNCICRNLCFLPFVMVRALVRSRFSVCLCVVCKRGFILLQQWEMESLTNNQPFLTLLIGTIKSNTTFNDYHKPSEKNRSTIVIML